MIREPLGSGTFMGYEIFQTVNNGGWYLPNGMLLLSPSAFFIIGVFIWVLRTVYPDQVEAE